MAELLPRVKKLARLAKHYDIGLNIDAEEADRLELSLDLLEALAPRPGACRAGTASASSIQAYGKRCPFVIDWLIDLARRSRPAHHGAAGQGRLLGRRDQARAGGRARRLPGVHAQGAHRCQLSRLCAETARRARAVFPQFATHNAQTLAAIHTLAGPDFTVGDYEFQCLHGMGEPLYDEVVGADKLDRPCRIYAPVGTHETLLAYLVRRLLENGANSSFVNRIADPAVSVDELIADPVDVVSAMPVPATPHDQIALPADLFGRDRVNSRGLDLAERDGAGGAAARRCSESGSDAPWHARPLLADGAASRARPRDVLNPADHADRVGQVTGTCRGRCGARGRRWRMRPREHWAAVAAGRARRLPRRAPRTCMEARMDVLIGLIMREAGKIGGQRHRRSARGGRFPALLRRAGEARRWDTTHEPLGPVVCISPWNFPLAIFTGQVAAALAAGNAVIAKPAEETPLIAAESVTHPARGRRAARRAAIHARRRAARRGAGGARRETAGVMFTGSTEVARLIQAQLAERLSAHGRPIPLIAETGGQNAMIVDSSALAEQVVADVDRLGLRQCRPALLGAARAVPAGGRGRPHARHAEGRARRTVARAHRPAVGRHRARSSRRRPRPASRRTSRRCATRATRWSSWPCRARPRRAPSSPPPSSRSTTSGSSAARCSARCCMCCAGSARTWTS